MTARAGESVQVEVEGRRLVLKNLSKVFYPETGFTKRDVLDYYSRIAPVLLPHLRGRPLTLKRYPEGVDGPFFFEKRCPPHRPRWLRTAEVWSEGKREHIPYCVVDDVASLVWLASIADLELHPSLSRASAMDRPTALAFDLDPGPPADLVHCCGVALLLRRLLDGLELASFPKTSGSKGLQIYVPLGGRASYDATKPFAHAVARVLEDRHPDLVVSRMTKSLRAGKVLVDWSQNDRSKTTVAAYSLRARPRPTVSTPLRWEEVERAAEKGRAEPLAFEAPEVLRRVKRLGDLFAPVLETAQRLPSPARVEHRAGR
jgi:bifunctional non-homologous end joining protein LigD